MRYSFPIAVLIFTVGCNTSPSKTPPPPAETQKSAPLVTPQKEENTLSPPTTTADAETKRAPTLATTSPVPINRQDIVAVSLLSPRSLSMKIRLKGGTSKVFKPILKTDTRARFEVAAFRMAAQLGVDGVPPATMVTLPSTLLYRRLSIDAEESVKALEENAEMTDKGWLAGAQIDWMTDLDPEGLKALGGPAVLKGWLSEAPIDRQMLARAASRMVCFDYLIGNWDRFSGGNFFLNKVGDGLVLLDHNGAFTPWGEQRTERMNRLLEKTERFSRSLIFNIRNLSEKQIRDAMAKETTDATTPLLTKTEITHILTRRDALLTHVDALLAKRGKSKVLVYE